MESKREEDGDKKQKKMSPALEKAYAELKVLYPNPNPNPTSN